MSAGPLSHPQVVVEQKRKFFELRNQYKLFATDGREIGAVEQATQGWVTFLLRLFSNLDVALPITLHVTDELGDVGLVLHKPWFRWAVEVRRGDGSEVGAIAKKLRIGKARFVLTGPAGEALGEVRAENWRARDFTVVDTTGREVARVTKKWRGLLTEGFTDADTYVVDLGDAQEPHRTLALAAALSVDVIMKQKDA